MLPGEIVEGTETTCMDCGAELKIQVCRSAAGHYIGFWCQSCGPYSRNSGYYGSHEEAAEALRLGRYGRV